MTKRGVDIILDPSDPKRTKHVLPLDIINTFILPLVANDLALSDIRQLPNLMVVCKKWYALMKDPRFWLPYLEKRAKQHYDILVQFDQSKEILDNIKKNRSLIPSIHGGISDLLTRKVMSSPLQICFGHFAKNDSVEPQLVGYLESFGKRSMLVGKWINETYFKGVLQNFVMKYKIESVFTGLNNIYGPSRVIHDNGLVVECGIVANRVCGLCTIIWPDGDKYTGIILNGLRHGFGTFYPVNGTPIEQFWDTNVDHARIDMGPLDDYPPKYPK